MSRLTPGDWVVYVIALTLSAWFASLPLRALERGPVFAHIASPDGEQVIALPSRERELIVPGPLGNSVIHIADDRIRFVQSPCPGKQCIHTGWLRRPGSTAACLPNRISVWLSGDDPPMDGVTF